MPSHYAKNLKKAVSKPRRHSKGIHRRMKPVKGDDKFTPARHRLESQRNALHQRNRILVEQGAKSIQRRKLREKGLAAKKRSDALRKKMKKNRSSPLRRDHALL